MTDKICFGEYGDHPFCEKRCHLNRLCFFEKYRGTEVAEAMLEKARKEKQAKTYVQHNQTLNIYTDKKKKKNESNNKRVK